MHNRCVWPQHTHTQRQKFNLFSLPTSLVCCVCLCWQLFASWFVFAYLFAMLLSHRPLSHCRISRGLSHRLIVCLCLCVSIRRMHTLLCVLDSLFHARGEMNFRLNRNGREREHAMAWLSALFRPTTAIIISSTWRSLKQQSTQAPCVASTPFSVLRV